VIAAGLPDPFARRRATELAAPDHTSHPTYRCVQIGHQGGDRFVRFAAVQLVIADASVWAVPGILDVPAAGIELNEATPSRSIVE